MFITLASLDLTAALYLIYINILNNIAVKILELCIFRKGIVFICVCTEPINQVVICEAF
jgi:hypothetical protein